MKSNVVPPHLVHQARLFLQHREQLLERKGEYYLSLKAIAKMCGISLKSLDTIKNGEAYDHIGFKPEYLEQARSPVKKRQQVVVTPRRLLIARENAARILALLKDEDDDES